MAKRKARVGAEESKSTSTTKGKSGRRPSPPATRTSNLDTRSRWVEEKTLGARPGKFAWRVDGKDELVLRSRLGTKRVPGEDMARLLAFMADGRCRTSRRSSG